MPAGPIEYQENAFVLSGSYLPGKLLESHREQRLVYRGQNRPVDLSGGGSDEAIEVGPLLSPLEPGSMGLLPTGAHTRLITGSSPKRASSSAHNSSTFAPGWASLMASTRSGRLFRKPPSPSFSEGSAEALEGLGSCGPYLTFLRYYSKPR
jgi:hypothetical protein